MNGCYRAHRASGLPSSDHVLPILEGPLNIIKNRLNLDLLQIPSMGAPGTPKVSHMSTLVRFQVKKTIKMESQIEKIHVPLKL